VRLLVPVLMRFQPIRRRPEGEEDESEKEINASASSADEVEDEEDSSHETGTSGKEKEDEDNDDDEKEDEDEEEGITDLNGDLDGGAEPDRPLPSRKRALGFKDWARNQMGQVARPIPPEAPQPPLPSVTAPTNGKLKHPYDAKTPFVGPLGAQVETPASSLLDTHGGLRRPTARPDIARRSSVSEARMNLPIFAEEQAIIEAIRMQPVVIIAGETGSGKTTQVPQMLYEAGFGFKGSGKLCLLVA